MSKLSWGGERGERGGTKDKGILVREESAGFRKYHPSVIGIPLSLPSLSFALSSPLTPRDVLDGRSSLDAGVMESGNMFQRENNAKTTAPNRSD